MKRHSLIGLSLLAGCADPEPNATRAGFEAKGLKWPLTVDSGTLGCDVNAVWFETADGRRYGVNGTASLATRRLSRFGQWT